MFAELVRAYRRQLGMTQDKLAEGSGLSVRSIRKIEAGRVAAPRAVTVRLLADVFGLAGTARDRFCHAATGEPAVPVDGNWTPVPPRQLPRPPPMFTGRSSELAAVDCPHDGSAPVVTAIDGMAGIGKTALALYAAHRLADRYPDGQLFIDLHGSASPVAPVEPGDALDRMLQAIGVPGERIPVGVEDRAALWRSLVAGRRMLMLLDNAAVAAQVAPLLPASPGCRVLVTSRRRLVGLEVSHTLSLDVMPLDAALALFTRVVGQPRLAAEPSDLAAETMVLCGNLPLAIRIAAGRFTSHPAWTLVDLVARLRDEEQRLAALEGMSHGVATALDLSYQELTAEHRQVYRLLGLHPGPAVTLHAAAALADLPIAPTRRCLDDLIEAHLLQEPTVGRFVFHDLVRVHAAGTATSHETEPERRAALTRLLDHYRHVASVAMDAVYPYERDRRPRVPPAAVPGPDVVGADRATAWLDAELANLVAVSRYAAAHGWPTHAWHMAATLHRRLRSLGRYGESEILHEAVLANACTPEQHTGRLHALLGLGDIDGLCGRYERALDRYRQASEIAHATGDRVGGATASAGLGHVHRLRGRHREALGHYRRALEFARTAGDSAGESHALIGLGHVDQAQGRHEEALGHYRRALAVAQVAGNGAAEVSARLGLGHIHLRLTRYAEAFEDYRRALETARATGNHTTEISALLSLGHVHLLRGRHGEAFEDYRRALKLARTIGNHTGKLSAWLGLGNVHLRRAEFGRAADRYQQVLVAAREMGSRNWQFEARQGLGRLNHATARPESAITHHQQALDLATELRQPVDQVRAHDGLAHAHRALQRPRQARRHWREALEILTGLAIDHAVDPEANAETIRTNLAGLDLPRARTSTRP